MWLRDQDPPLNRVAKRDLEGKRDQVAPQGVPLEEQEEAVEEEDRNDDLCAVGEDGGDLLVCAATWQSSTATASVSDSRNGTWTAISAAKAGIGSLTGYSGQMFYIPSAASAATTVTLTTSTATQFRSLECAEYS